ncbi:helix-turn-helix domain-containing protein [Ruminococcus flavefaciens]|uniref:Regulatory protein MerR n=1 Tax=Ruminococcus flavefaciens 007c TaxID=1341157 RepID=W7UNY2_RUMFL|nr:helix-turn-helix domain-containing protein [Ruminococcus flavefaciens]EWM53174.1 regulatory protein MerR [Ruminococcus flavefaciens 007c]
MSNTEKKRIVDDILELLIQLTDDGVEAPVTNRESVPKPVEMLTIKECTEVIQGLSEHTVRQLVAQEKIKSVRTGEGKRGKILVNKADLVAYFQK